MYYQESGISKPASGSMIFLKFKAGTQLGVME